MHPTDLATHEWILAGLIGLIVGGSKTGLPGAGILAVPAMAALFGGRSSVGILLPMLITADVFAVAFYRRHARWDKLVGLVPWVLVGITGGAVALWWFAEVEGGRVWFKPLIGGVVLAMLALHLARKWLGDRLTPRDALSVGGAGAATGFATTIANSAGPIMTIYLAGNRLPKEQFMGTMAWFFLLLNVSKVPLYLALDWHRPVAERLISGPTLLFDLCMAPVVVCGALGGAWLFRRMNQRFFEVAVLLLATATAIHLCLAPITSDGDAEGPEAAEETEEEMHAPSPGGKP